MAQDYFRNYFKELFDLFEEVEITNRNGKQMLKKENALEKLVEEVLSTKKTNKKIMIIGNGGSAAIAAHQALDYVRSCNIRAMSFDNPSLLTCMSNDFGYERIYEKLIENYADEDDVLIAISSSGKSLNIMNGVNKAIEKGCKVVTLSGFKEDNPLRKLGIYNFYVPSLSYGHVEMIHSLLLHCVVDYIKESTVHI